jgi:hypothetical protein
VEHNKPATVIREKATVYQLTQLADDRQRQRLAHAEEQRLVRQPRHLSRVGGPSGPSRS